MNEISNRVNMTSDGLALDPDEYARLLARLSRDGRLEADSYCAGGSVAKLEKEMAQTLGKEAAIVMPTGTMANLLAVQYLAGVDPKVIVQHESHLYNDCGDCGAALARLQLVPLTGGAGMQTGDIAAVLARARNGKVEARPGVISVESPLRRLDGEMCSFANMQAIARLARASDIRLHLDGARLPVMAAYTGRPMRQYAALFDTVYVSLYKGFNSLSGGILAGERGVIEKLRHWRRRNGGGMAQYWPIAAVALYYLPGVVERLAEAIDISRAFFAHLGADERFEHIPVPGGSSVSHLRIRDADMKTLGRIRAHLQDRDIYLPVPDGNPAGFTIKVNESWRRTTPDRLFAEFQAAVAAA